MRMYMYVYVYVYQTVEDLVDNGHGARIGNGEDISDP